MKQSGMHRGAKSNILSQLREDIREYLLKKRIMITAEYPPGALNKKENFQSRNVNDFSKSKLNSIEFQKICH